MQNSKKTRNDVTSPRRRGRPPSHDPEQVLKKLCDTFWESGFSGTSLDQLAGAAGVNRPTLYATFGDKHSMYLAALQHFSAEMRADAGEALREPQLEIALRRFYQGAIDRYMNGGKAARGCLVLCTAVSEVPQDSEIRRLLKHVLAEIDDALCKRLTEAQNHGQLPTEADPRVLSQMLGALLHSIALRARAGQSRASLEKLVSEAVPLLCRQR